MDAAEPRVSAIAVQGGRILAVGNDLSDHIGPETKVLDLAGATVVPGFIDSHGHMAGLGESLEVLDLREARSAEEVIRRVERAVQAAGEGAWIQGRSWDQTRWPGGQFPDKAALSAAAPNHPVYLTRVDGHAAWVNERALVLAGITRETPDPPGGKIHRDRNGEATGILIDRATALVRSKIPPPTTAQIRQRLERAAAECARLGLTGVHDAGIGPAEIAAYRELVAEGRLPVRVYAMLASQEDLLREWLARGPETGDFLTIRAIKLMADGALGSRGAALKEPYADDPENRGLLILDQAGIERVARRAVEHGFQVNTHAIGDRAVRVVLDAYAAALGGPNDRRFRVELFQRYSVIPVMQATHATSDMRWAAERLGDVRIRGAYAWRRFLSMGLPVPNGSDFPVESPNPLWGFYAAITRQDHDGWPDGGWQPDQRMTRQEALRSWTLDGAYAAFEEHRRGSITPGKLADFVALSRDIMEVAPKEILDTRVTMTVLGGRVVYSGAK
mgnify:CR=1 FL=1